MDEQPKVRWLDQHCHNCGEQLNSWDARCSKALSYKYAVCEKCIADEYGCDVDKLRATFEAHFGMTPCMGI